jgi:hypothetical protein
LRDPISKNPSQKRAGGVAQSVGPEFKPQYHKNKQTNKQKPELLIQFLHVFSVEQRLWEMM